MSKKMFLVGLIVYLFILFLSGCSENTSDFSVQIEGPSSVEIGDYFSLSANVSGGTRPYTYQWELDGDNDFSDAENQLVFINSSETCTFSPYIAYVKVIDSDGKTISEQTSIQLVVGGEDATNSSENHPPMIPDAPIGSCQGNVQDSYYFAQDISDPDGDLIRCRFSWGDGTFSDWSELMKSGSTYHKSHIWSVEGNFEVKIKLKDMHGLESQWSNSTVINISNKNEGEKAKLDCISILSYMCSPIEGDYTGLQPSLETRVNKWFESKYSGPNSFILTWYLKMNDEWIQIKQQTIFEGGSYYCYCDEANEYSTTYYWRVKLENESGGICDDYSFNFVTYPNQPPHITYSEPGYMNGDNQPLQPLLTVEISDPYGDKMDLSWYIKIDDIWTLTNIQQSLSNGTYSYGYENADEYGERYYWKVKVTDEFGLYDERICVFTTLSPQININEVLPEDGETFLIYISNHDYSSAYDSIVFSARVSNSEGHQMDVEFFYHSQSIGTITKKIQNVGNGTYSWEPSEQILYAEDNNPNFYVKATDLEWEKHQTGGFHNLNIKRAWMELSKNETNKTLTVIELKEPFPNEYSWQNIGVGGTCTLPNGSISVGDVIINCDGEVSLYWEEVDLIIDSWIFT